MTAGVTGDRGDLERERRLLLDALTQAFGAASSRDNAGAATQDDAGAATREDADGATREDTGACAREGSDDPSEPRPAAIGCACCGCRSPRLCSACPVCRGGAAALDPHVLERVADVAALLAEGLRAAAQKLSTQTPQHTEQDPQRHTPQDPPGDDEGNLR